MLYLNKNGLLLSKIALGGADFGTALDKVASFEIMDAFFENGGNVIDTARVYAEWRTNGKNASEQTIGEWICDRKFRDKVIISTKGAHPPHYDMQTSRLNKTDIEYDLNQSLKYLKTDYVDIYFLHRDDKNKPVSEIMPILDTLVKSGKVKKIGASNWTADRIKEANIFARENGLTEFSFSQIMYSYASVNENKLSDATQIVMNDIEYKKYKSLDLTIMAYGAQAQGFYSKVANKGFANLSPSDKDKYDNQTNRDRFGKLDELSKVTNIPHSSLGLIPLIMNEDFETLSIIGISKKSRLFETLSAVKKAQELCGKIKD